MEDGLGAVATPSHAGPVETDADGDTESGDTGVGISLALSIASDSALATTARYLVAGGAMSFNARSILSTSSRMIRIDCWFFAGWAKGVIPSRAPRI